MTTETATDDHVGAETGAGPATETCDMCGAVIEPDPGESRFEAVVAHFECAHVHRQFGRPSDGRSRTVSGESGRLRPGEPNGE